MILLEIAVAAPVLQTYSYRLPERLAVEYVNNLQSLVGRRVFVPFGPRKITGYVLASSEPQESAYKLKDIIEILDDNGFFHENIIPLFKWVAEYYHYPIGEVIKTALPAGLSIESRQTLSLTEKISVSGLPDEEKLKKKFPWLAELEIKKSLGANQTKKVFAKAKNRKFAEKLAESGFIKIEKSRTKERISKKTELCYRIINKDEDLQALLGKAELKALRYLLKLVEENSYRDVPRKELLALYPYGAKVLGALEEKKIIESFNKRVYRTPFGDLLPKFDPPETLTDEQLFVLSSIDDALSLDKYKTFLLNGVTGSGKTEVYLRASEKVLKTKKGVLVLVPEIALATQVEAHFVSRFGEKVALLHSGLSAGERYDEWSRIYSGEASIVIGARSAVFAPIKDLGLIIVDEEHDSSFKQEDKLRYNSRDISVLRAKFSRAIAVLGSATPAITSYKHALSNKYTKLEMKNRVGGRNLPEIKIIDLKKEKINSSRIFHKDLLEAILQTFNEGNQSILLLNRRGFSASVICKDCGAMVECKHCKVTLNMHKGRKKLVCHYCGYSLPEKVLCNTCGSGNLAPVGIGTERIEEEIKKHIPDAKVARLDSDIAQERKNFLSILQSVRTGEIDILVGTQMIAKGLHFPGVTLVGVVWADGGLAFPDYRAAEKTYQLIAQVTGRAGRGAKPGRVIIQTMQPDHYAIKLASSHDYHKLAVRELKIRENAGFPPYVRLVSIKIEGIDEQNVRNQATEIASLSRGWCRKCGSETVLDILGPAPAPIEKIKDMYRWQILIKGRDIGQMHNLVDFIKKHFRGKTAIK